MNILTTIDVSNLLHVDVRTLQKQAQSGYFPSHVCGRIGRKYLFNEEALLKFIFSSNTAVQI